MKRAFAPGEGWGGRLRGAGRLGGRALPWIGAGLAAYGIYGEMKSRGGVSWANLPGAVLDEGLRQAVGAAHAPETERTRLALAQLSARSAGEFLDIVEHQLELAAHRIYLRPVQFLYCTWQLRPSAQHFVAPPSLAVVAVALAVAWWR